MLTNAASTSRFATVQEQRCRVLAGLGQELGELVEIGVIVEVPRRRAVEDDHPDLLVAGQIVQDLGDFGDGVGATTLTGWLAKVTLRIFGVTW